jgi:hypothetical protein
VHGTSDLYYIAPLMQALHLHMDIYCTAVRPRQPGQAVPSESQHVLTPQTCMLSTMPGRLDVGRMGFDRLDAPSGACQQTLSMTATAAGVSYS